MVRKRVLFHGGRTGNSVIEVDRGAQQIYATLGRMRGNTPSVHVGYQGYLAERATINEFGAPVANIPERSFIRSTYDEEQPEMIKIRDKFMEKVILGKLDPKIALAAVGHYLAEKIQQKIVELKDPPNAPLTIAKKGFDDPLIEHGDMLRGIIVTVSE